MTKQPYTTDELDKLFARTSNIRKTAVNTAIMNLESMDDTEIAEEANKLLDKYRFEFKAAITAYCTRRERELLERLKLHTELFTYLDKGIQVIPLAAIDAELKRLGGDNG